MRTILSRGSFTEHRFIGFVTDLRWFSVTALRAEDARGDPALSARPQAAGRRQNVGTVGARGRKPDRRAAAVKAEARLRGVRITFLAFQN